MINADFTPEDFQELFHIPTMIFAKFDEQGTLIGINDPIEKILGWKPAELIGKKYSEFLSPDQKQDYPKTNIATRSPFLHKNGKFVWIAWLSRSKGDYCLVVGREVTDTIEYEEALNLASKRLSLAVKIGGVGVFEWRPETDEIIPDETTDRIHGLEPGQGFKTGTAMGSMIHRDDFEAVGKKVMHGMHNRIPYNVEYRIIRPGGEMRWIKCAGVPFDERPIRVIGTLIDITEQKVKSEDQTLLSEISDMLSSSFDYQANLASALERITQTFCDQAVVDHYRDEETVARICASRSKEGEVTITRKTFRNSSFQMEIPEVARIAAGEIVHIKDRNKALEEYSQYYPREYIDNLRTEGAKSDLVVLLKRHDHIMGVLILTLKEHNPRTFQQRDIELTKEISYRISVAMENSLLYISSQEAVHARDEFLSVASHELKTPLQSLTLQNEMLARHLEANQNHELNRKFIYKSLEGDKRQLKRITRLIDDMLDITRIQNSRMSIDMEAVDFVDLLQSVVDRMRPAFDSLGMKLTLSMDERIIVHVDSFRIEQVISNILTNALKYGNGRPVEVCAKVENAFLFFSVTDQGHGIKKEDQQRILQRFERASSKIDVTGLGLGLYICQKIVEAHEGQIIIKSEIDKGSTFIVKLPLRDQ